MFNTEIFKTLLDSRGIKQSQLSRMTDIPRNLICRYLSGKVQPKADKVKLLATALGVPMETLLVKEADEIPAPVQRPKRQLCFCPNCGVGLEGIAE